MPIPTTTFRYPGVRLSAARGSGPDYSSRKVTSSGTTETFFADADSDSGFPDTFLPLPGSSTDLSEVPFEEPALENFFTAELPEAPQPAEPVSESDRLMDDLGKIKTRLANTQYEAVITRMMDKLELIEATPPEDKEIIEARWHEVMGLYEMLHSAGQTDKLFTESVQAEIDSLMPALNNLCPQFTTQADPRSKAGFMKVFSAVRLALNGIGDTRIGPTLDLLWEILVRREALSAEDWEFISLKLEKLVALIPQSKEGAILNGYRIGFIKKNLDYLAFISAAAWTESNHKNLVDYLTNENYKKKFNDSYSALDTHTGSVSVSMPGVSTTVSIGRTSGLTTDDEGFLGRMDTTKAGVALSANLGLSSVKAASVGIEGSGTTGMYVEWNKARHFVLDNFNQLLSEHHADPKVAAYLTRIETGVLPQGLRTEIIADTGLTDDAILRVTTATVKKDRELNAENGYRTKWLTGTMDISMNTVSATRLAYERHSTFMAQSFSVLLGDRADIDPARPAGDAAVIRPDLLNIEQGNALVVPYTAVAGKVKSLAGLESELGSLNVNAALEGSVSGIVLTKHFSMCEALGNTFDDAEYNYNPEIQSAHRKQMTDEIIKKSLGIRIKLNADDRTYAKRRIVEKDRLQTVDHDAQQESATELTFLTEAGQIWTDVSSTGTEAALLHNAEKLKLAFKHLKASFNRYELLQTQLINRDLGAKEAVDAFHKMMGVESAEKCLYRLLLLNAWIYTQVLELQKSPTFRDSAATFRTELENQDKAILNCNCPVNKDTLKELATFQQEGALTTKDIKLGGGAIASATPWGIEALAMGALQLVVTALQRFRNHTNPLRQGNYRDIEIRIGAGITAGSRKTSMEYIYKKITEQAGTECVFDVQDAQNIEQFLDSTTVTSGALVLNFRWYKPTLFPGLGYRFWNMRATVATDTTFSVNTPTPFVSGGYSYERVRTDFLHEIYSSSSILLFALRYFHDYCIGDIDTKSGAIGEDSNYGKVRQLKADTLKALFKNTGQMHTAGRSDYSVIKELDAMEKEFQTITGLKAEDRSRINTAKCDFLDAAKNYSAADSAENYELALAAFDKVMHTYSAYLLSMKKKSALFRPKQFELLDTRYHSENTILERISELFRRRDSHQLHTTDQPDAQPATVQIPPSFQAPAAQPAA